MKRVLNVVAALLILLPALAAAQGRVEGTISGTVTDETKGVLPGVTVTANNPQTGFTREAITDAEGTFLLPLLPPAQYEVVASLPGFSTFRQMVNISVGSETRLAIGLSVATLQESITVTGEAPLVEVTKTEQGSSLNSNEMMNLPTTSRSYLALAQLSPGVVSQGGGFSASGSRNTQNNFNVDGMSNKNLNGGGDFGRVSPEGIQEFNVVTQSYPAEYGGATGGVTNAVSKSGTNNLTGYGFWYQRHNAFDKPPFNTRAAADGTVEAFPVAEANFTRRYVRGVTVGGPIIRDKAFFFGVVDVTNSHVKRLRTLAPNTITVMKGFLPDLPDTLDNGASDFKNWDATSNGKFDYNLSSTNTLSFTGSLFKSYNPAGAVNGRSSVYSTTEQRNTTKRVGGGLNSVLSDRSLNTFRAQYFRNDQRTKYPNRGGFENVGNWQPGIVIAGGTGGNFGLGELGTMPHEHQWETHYEIQNVSTLYRNNHQFKFGGNFMWVDILQYSHYYGLGEWRFSDLNAVIAGRPSGFVQSFGSTGAYIVAKHVSGFAQDEWQPFSKLTINYGVRYDVIRLPGDLSSVELPEPAFNQATGQFDTKTVSNSRMKGFRNDTNNFQPRIGFAYALNDKTLIRGGGGLFYGAAHYGEMAQGFANSVDGYARYDFPSVEAAAIWAGLRDPSSPLYNGGRLRLAQNYRRTLEAQPGRTFSQFFHPSDFDVPRSMQATFGVERQLNSWLSASGTFLWNRGDGDYRSQNINPPAAQFFPAGATLPSGVITPFDVNYRPENGVRPDPTRANVYTYTMVTRTRYKGGSVGLNARRGGLQLRGAYTYSDSWDDGSDVSTRLLPSDSDCVPCEYAKSILSTTHHFRGAAVYQLPQSLPFYARNWQVSAIQAAQSGAPILTIASFDFNNDNVVTDRPFGVPRTALVGESRYTTDLRIARFFPIRSDMRVEMFFEMFNVFNAANFTGYDANLYRLQGGRYVPYADFAPYHNDSAKLNTGFKQGRDKIDPSEIGLDPKIRRTGVGDPRQGQIGFRFHF